MKQIQLFLFFFTFAAALVRNYQNTLQLIPQYNVSWNIQGDTLQLALQVATTGWVGFGIGEPTSGSMPGADIVTGTVGTDGTISITDRYATEFAMPTQDDCQNWVAISGSQVAGITTLELERKLVTNDIDQDRIIGSGPTRILFAFGITPVFQYHGTINRHLGVIYFFPNNATSGNLLPANAQTLTLLMNNFTVPNVDTTYACQSFVLPVGPSLPDYHIIQIDPILDPVTSAYVHHFVVQKCAGNSTFVQQRLAYANYCFPSPCEEYIWAWAPGTGSLILPPEAGYRMSYVAPGFQYLILQIHYNNPNLVAGLVDQSGIRITYTPTLRQYDAGVLQLGDATVSAPPIPPGISLYPFEFTCPSQCTSYWPNNLIVFADFMHMHQIGRQMYTTHWRNNTYLGVINRVDFYQFALQQTTTVNWVIQPGDRLSTHCNYDSSLQTSITTFGLESTNEMCIDFVYYYPALSSGYCGYVRDPTDNQTFTLCGEFNPADPYLPLSNPTIRDPFELPILFGNPFNGTCGTGTTTPTTTPHSGSQKNILSLALLALIILLLHL